MKIIIGILSALIFLVLTFVTVSAAEPPIRSTRYNGIDGESINYGNNLAYDSSVAMTIEAWIYRDDPGGCRTIVGRGIPSSYWFGFCDDRLRFYRSGSSFAEAGIEVPIHQWTHVGVSYDGRFATFYVDGFPAGAPRALAHDGADKPGSLWLGSTPLSGFHGPRYLFQGYLDEVRIWMRALPQSEILRNLYREVTTGGSLAFVAPNGGTHLRGQVFGILPRDLVVRKARWPVTTDGMVDLDGEYRGAEQLVIRYRDGRVTADAVAYLVYRSEGTDQNLYIGVKPVRDTRPRWPRSNSWISVQIDPDHSRNRFAAADDFQIKGQLSGEPGTWMLGNGWGGYALPAASPATALWQVAYSYFGFDLDPPTMEFRIARPLLGEWNQTDGLMIGHLEVGGSGDNYPAPGNSSSGAPETWANVTYGDALATPLAIIAGAVLDRDNTRPVAGHRVSLVDAGTGSVLYTQNTNASGGFSFSSVAVPRGRDLKVQIDGCDQCRYRNPSTYAGIAPIATSPLEVTFPGATSGTARYATIDFILLRPLPPITITSVEPPRGAPSIRLRAGDRDPLPGDRVKLRGTNLHEYTQAYLFERGYCPEVPPLSDCVLNRHYFEATVTDHAADGSWLEVEIPAIPEREWSQYWFFGVFDSWARPGVSGISSNFNSWTTSPRVMIEPTRYPLVHGFRFKNESSTARLTDFEGVFGNNSRICVIWFFGCRCRILDPVYYTLYFPVYAGILNSIDGSCNGMASTSLLFSRRNLNPGSFTPGVNYAAGLPGSGGFDPGDTREKSPQPARYSDYDLCEPYNPHSLWAHIKVNHGVQISDEYIQSLFDQMTGAGLVPTSGERVSSISGDPRSVLSRITANPRGYVLAMTPDIGDGHVVTPYAIGECEPARADCKRIKVYDNNYPQVDPSAFTEHYVEIDTTTNRYLFPKDLSGAIWSGNGIYAMPIGLWTSSRSFPGPITLHRFISLVVFGDADGLYTAPDGGQWGWRPDGTVMDTLKGARALTPLGAPGGTRNVPLGLPIETPPPAVQINVRGSHYYFHTAQGGQVVQLENLSGVAGDQEQVSLSYQDGRLSSFRFSPERRAANFIPKIGMFLGERERAVFLWKGLQLEGGKSLEFKSLPTQRGVELKNDSADKLDFDLIVHTLDGASGNATTYRFGPFEVPAGATHRVIFNDWPVARQLKSSLDLNSDGTFETVAIVEARDVISNVSAASYKGPELAAESVVSVSGQDLATTSAMATSQLQTELGDTTVEVRDSANHIRSAPLFFVSPGQIIYQLPPGTANGKASVTVIGGNGSLSIGTVPIVSVAPGLFTANEDGQGVAAGQVLRIKADKTEVYEPLAQFDQQKKRFVSRPIDFGSNEEVFLLLSGTGIRNRSSLSAVTASIDGLRAEVLYAAEERGSPGRDQVKLRLSRRLRGHGDVRVVLIVEGKNANIVTINVK